MSLHCLSILLISRGHNQPRAVKFENKSLKNSWKELISNNALFFIGKCTSSEQMKPPLESAHSSFFSIVRSDISVILVQNWHHGVSKSAKKIVSTGYWTHNTNPSLRIPASLTTQPPRHLLNRISLNWTWIISGSIEHDFKRVWKFETGMDWQIGWVGKGAGIFIVGWCCEFNTQFKQFFADFETLWC